MGDRRKHRGAHPSDADLFAPANVPALQTAVNDLSWLLSNGYAEKSALKLVGDRYNLKLRQRKAAQRASCTDDQAFNRNQKRITLNKLQGQVIEIDAYNTLITIESALAGGYLFLGKDGCFRDLASIHGTWRKVAETLPAIKMVDDFLSQYNPTEIIWYLDKPVSNSGRLAGMIREVNPTWQVALVKDPDPILAVSENIIVTHDSWILDQAKVSLNLTKLIVEANISHFNLIDLT